MSWTRVQSAGNVDSSASGNITVSLTGVAVGDLLVCAITTYGPAIGSIGDTVNTWHKLGSQIGSGAYTDLWYTVVTTGGSLTITGTTQAYSAIAVVEFNSGGGTISTDGSVVSINGDTSSPASGNITITTPALVVGGFGTCSVNSNTWSSTGSYTYDSTSGANFVSGTHYGVAIGYNLAAASSPADPALSLSTLCQWAAVGAAFQATSAANTGGGQSLLAGV